MKPFSQHAAVLLGATLVSACGSPRGDVPTAEVRSAIEEAIHKHHRQRAS